MTYECPDECGRYYGSIKAALLCQCDQYDMHGHPKHIEGGDWLP